MKRLKKISLIIMIGSLLMIPAVVFGAELPKETTRTYTIKYTASGGKGTMKKTVVIYGTPKKLRANTFKRTGYSFKGWHAHRESDNKWLFSNGSRRAWYLKSKKPSGYKLVVLENQARMNKQTKVHEDVITLNAVWSANKATINYDANGGSGKMAKTPIKYGVDTKLQSNTFKRSRHEMIGWYAYRKSDGKWHYSKGNKAGWYRAEKAPSGYKLKIYSPLANVSKLSSINKDVITMQAVWEMKTRYTKAGTLVDKSKIAILGKERYFKAYKISDEVFKRINGKTYKKNDDIAISDLRYVKVLHYDFKGKVRVGELIVNADVAKDILYIFGKLYDKKYQINSMRLLDDYWVGSAAASDSNSIDHNNTSGFCYRRGTGMESLSQHAYGRAIDINPQQNPYVLYVNGKPTWSHNNANKYIDRTTGAKHMITKDDLCYKLFKERGFTWGGDWGNPKDYQHFEK